MNSNSGLSTEDAQLAICKGTYGGKEWSAEEKQAACERYETLTGTKTESQSEPVNVMLVAGMAVIIVVLVAVVYKLYTIKSHPKKINKKVK